jgi:two-component system CheB/CheR fusion protein
VPPELSAILEEVGRPRGLDFRAYKRGTLLRRTRRRMSLREVATWAEYHALLRQDPREASALYNDLLIGVTRFFRDAPAWKHLEQEVLPPLLRDRPPGTALRAWVPACASGEEAYSLAILMLEQVAAAGRADELQILASDVDAKSVELARRGNYPAAIERDISPERLRRYFVRHGDTYQVTKTVRAAITFSVHNLLSDPPFAKLDLVSCRNLLIYLEPQAQQQVLEIFHFALRPGGVLILGSAETIGRQADMFETVSKKWRVYRRVGSNRPPRFHASPFSSDAAGGPGPRASGPPLRAAQSIERLVRDFVLKRFTTACVVVNSNFELLYVFGPTERYLVQPVGEVRTDLLAWARPGLYAKLRGALQHALEHGSAVSVSGVRVERDGAGVPVRCTVEPLSPGPSVGGLLVVSFQDDTTPAPIATSIASVEDPLARQLEQELRATRRELDASLQQLETTDEEHRASHEELLSLNEELQSTNEELETSKEELQSLNEEITRVNAQLEDRNAELRVTNQDLRNFLSSVDVPVLFLDRELHIRRYTPAVEHVMRMVESDVGRSIAHIKLRFQDDRLLPDAAAVLDRLVPISAEVETDEGRWFIRRVLPYRGPNDEIAGLSITFNEITVQKRSAIEIEDARAYAEAIVATIPLPLLVVDDELRVVSANAGFFTRFGGTPAEIEGGLVYAIRGREWDIPELRQLLEEVLPQRKSVDGFAIEHTFADRGRRCMVLSARELQRGSGRRLILVAIEDVTAYAEAEIQIRRQAAELREEHQRKDEFLAMLGHELRNPLAAIGHATELLATARDDAARVDALRGTLSRHTARITALVDQLLEVSRVISGKIELRRQPLDIAEIVADAVEAAMPLVRASGQVLEVLGPPTPAFVRGDASRLVQVMENLLTNAAKYTQPGGRIEVTIEGHPGEVSIAVRDDGFGIEADLLPHVFDLFTQERRSLGRARGGLGLGLPLAKQLVEMHGGRITAASEGPGRGSEFVVTLLRCDPPARRTPSTPAPSDAPTPTPPPHRILVVDDEEDAASMLAEILGTRGHETKAVSSADAAIEAVRAFRPDVVLLDLGLPHTDGYEVARRLRQAHGNGLFLVALTGYQADPARLAEAGFDRHLLKPADLDKLARWLAARSS